MTSFDDLLAGYGRFRRDGWEAQLQRWSTLAAGQSPRTLVIACSDSRVDPATIFDTSPGEIFVVRNVAALVPPFEDDDSHHGTSAAIEFAVTQLKVAEILVMGHEFCGGCKAALTGAFADALPGAGGFVRDWVALLDDGRARVEAAQARGDDAERAMEREAVAISLRNLRTFPFVAAAEAAGELRLRGSWFAIRDGVLRLLDETSGSFSPA